METYDNEDSGAISPFLQWLFEWVGKDMNATSGPYRVYFDSQFDSNQNEFEQKSNLLEIGVVAPNEALGCVLLKLLACIVLRSLDPIYSAIDYNSPDERSQVPYASIYTTLCENDGGVHSCDLAGPFVTELLGKDGERIAIAKNWSSSDIWSWLRLQDTFIESFDEYYEA